MKLNMRNRNAFLVLSLLLVGAWLSFLTWRPQPNAMKLAYVQADYLFENYAGSTEAYHDLQTKTAQWSEGLDSLSTAYKAVYASYNSQKATLASAQRSALEQQLQQRQTAFERYHQQVEADRKVQDERLTEALLTQIDAYIRAYAEEEGYDMIFSSGGSSNLVYSKETYNVTEAVLAYINKRYKDE